MPRRDFEASLFIRVIKFSVYRDRWRGGGVGGDTRHATSLGVKLIQI